MPVITLTTDWNLDDFYIGAVKGKIISQCPDVTIIDIAHQIPNFNLAQAAFILKNSYHQFPKGTIHIIGINTEPSAGKGHVVVQAEGHFFISCDNGILDLILPDKPDAIIRLGSEGKTTFPASAIFCQAACHLAKGKKIQDLGKPLKNLAKSVPLRATIDDSVITGSVIYIDSFQNAITNITKDLFHRVGKNKPFEILVTSNYYRITKLNKTYGETSVGEILALFNSLDLLEIAINNGNVAKLLNLNTGSTIRIQFRNKKENQNRK